MKKMMLIAAVIATAALTQAAVMNWQSGAIYLPTSAADGTWSTVNKVAGGTSSPVTAYFFILTEAEYNSATLLGDTTSAMMAGTYNLAAADNTVKPFTTTRAANWNSQGSYNVGDSGYMLAIFTLDSATASFDQDWFMVATGMGTISDNGASVTIQNMASSIGEWTAVPEPTSMALLAFGVAALGLRRKIRK